MIYLLDTNVCVALLRGRHQAVVRRLLIQAPAEIALCSVVKAELFYGALHSTIPTRSLTQLVRFFALTPHCPSMIWRRRLPDVSVPI